MFQSRICHRFFQSKRMQVPSGSILYIWHDVLVSSFLPFHPCFLCMGKPPGVHQNRLAAVSGVRKPTELKLRSSIRELHNHLPPQWDQY